MRLHVSILVCAFAASSTAALAHSNSAGFVTSEPQHHDERPLTGTGERFPAFVRLDPRKVRNIVLKVNAQVVNVRNPLTGRRVRRGELLAEFESAELETIQRTYVETFSNMDAVRAFSVTGDEKLIEGRMNLEWRGLSPEALRWIEEHRQPVRRVQIVAPVDGYLLDVNVVEGQIVNAGSQSGLFGVAGETLFRIAESGAMTIDLMVPERAASRTKVGKKASVWLPAQGGGTEQVECAVEEVLQTIDPATQRRTVRLRPLQIGEAGMLPANAMLFGVLR